MPSRQPAGRRRYPDLATLTYGHPDLLDDPYGHFFGGFAAGHGLGDDQLTGFSTEDRKLFAEPDSSGDAGRASRGYGDGGAKAVGQRAAQQRSKRGHSHEHH